MQLAHILWRILTNISIHRQVIQVLRLKPFSAIAETNPKVAFKYLATKYLARNLTVAERASCFVHHYTRLYDLIPNRALHQILHWDIEFCSVFEAGSHLALTIGTSRPFDNEGELSLLLKMDGEIFFTLSFTIVPGSVVSSKAAEVLLISRIQGTPGYSLDQMRFAIDSMHSVRPRALLLSALEGIALALGIDEIASVSTRNQIDYCKELDSVFRSNYDDFFAELGLARSDAGFFVLNVPLDDKPLALIKRGHKIRTRKKQAFRRWVRLACFVGFLKLSDRSKGSYMLNGELVTQEINELEAAFLSGPASLVERAELSHPASSYRADEEALKQ